MKIQCHLADVNLLFDLTFTKLAWPRSTFGVTPSSSSETVRARELSRPLAMLTMIKETLRFHNFYALFSSVSPVSKGMGLRSPPFGRRSAAIKFLFSETAICFNHWGRLVKNSVNTRCPKGRLNYPAET